MTSKAANLARIRNNQRRSRARRKDYIADLEEKISRYEAQGSEPITIRLTQHLQAENDLLKKLLVSLGLDDSFLKSYIKASGAAKDALDKADVLGGGACLADEQGYTLDATDLTDSVNTFFGKQILHPLRSSHNNEDDSLVSCDVNPSQHDQRLNESVSLLETSTGLSYPSQGHTISAQSRNRLHDMDQLGLNTADAEVLKEEEASENTTLCSLAFSLVWTNNRKGYTVADLDARMRVGYICQATPTEGCRITNKVLFSVLAEIS